jgi:type VI secretion system protein VasG
VVIPYYPLSPAMIESITGHQFSKIAKRLRTGHDAELVIGDGVMDTIVARCTEIESGGRMIDAILTNTMLPEMSVALLERQVDGEQVAEIKVRVEGDGFAYEFLPAAAPIEIVSSPGLAAE